MALVSPVESVELRSRRGAPFPIPELPESLEGETWGAFVTEWSTGGTGDESRRAPRRTVNLEVLLTDPGWWETANPLPVRGECRNLSDNGLYMVAPIGYGLAVGQRYLFHVGPTHGRGPHESRHGTVVRAEVVLGDDADHLGLGVCFDGLPD